MERFKINCSKRLAVSTELHQFCYLAKDDDFMEVTSWTNHEGYDISLSDNVGNRVISITDGEFTALKKLIKALVKEENREFNERMKSKR